MWRCGRGGSRSLSVRTLPPPEPGCRSAWPQGLGYSGACSGSSGLRRCCSRRAEAALPPLRLPALPAIGTAAPSGSPGGHSELGPAFGKLPALSQRRAGEFGPCWMPGAHRKGAVTALREWTAQRKDSERLLSLQRGRERSLPDHHHGHNTQNLGILMTLIANKTRAG